MIPHTAIQYIWVRLVSSNKVLIQDSNTRDIAKKQCPLYCLTCLLRVLKSCHPFSSVLGGDWVACAGIFAPCGNDSVGDGGVLKLEFVPVAAFAMIDVYALGDVTVLELQDITRTLALYQEIW